MPQTVEIRSVLIVDKRRLSAESIDDLARAKNGDILLWEPIQFDAVKQLIFFEPEAKKLQKKDEKKRPRSKPAETVDATPPIDMGPQAGVDG